MDWNDLLRATVRDALGPTSIFHWSYLLSAYVLALVWLITVERLSVRNAFNSMHSKHIWLTRSSQVDLILTLGFVVCLARPISTSSIGHLFIVFSIRSRRCRCSIQKHSRSRHQ